MPVGIGKLYISGVTDQFHSGLRAEGQGSLHPGIMLYLSGFNQIFLMTTNRRDQLRCGHKLTARHEIWSR